MGTSGSYTGAGGKSGKDVAEGLNDWLDSLPDDGGADSNSSSSDYAEDGGKQVKELPSKVISGLFGLLGGHSRSRSSSDGPGSGGTGGISTSGTIGRARAGSSRSIQRLASVGGRAGAGAFAFVRRDVEGLRSLGLEYAELSALGDPLEVTRRIVDCVCDQQSSSTLEESEERYVAANVADWVFTQSEQGIPPDADYIARFTIASIVTEIISTELGQVLHDRTNVDANVAEEELRNAAWVLAGQAGLSSLGPTPDELTAAIEEGVKKLRDIYGAGS